MTLKQKLIEQVGEEGAEIIASEICPQSYGFTNNRGDSDTCDLNCEKCWNQQYIEVEKPSSEAVNHPDHYQGKHECIEVMRALFGDEAVKGFCRCNAFKYRFRATRKNGEEDIKKAEWYEEYLMKMEGCE